MKLHMNIGILIPGGPIWDADFALCLTQLCNHILMRPMKGVRQIQFSIINERGSNLCKMRQSLMDKAIARGCDYALFIDCDQTFPSNTLYRMLHWKMPLVACNVPIKTIPSTPTARSFAANHLGGHVVYSDPDKHGIEQVWRIGTGIMLIDLSVVKTLPRPWFMLEWQPEVNDYLGEDWWFVRLLERHGVKPYIDHDLSREVGHRGMFTFTHDMVGEVVRVPIEEGTPNEAPAPLVVPA